MATINKIILQSNEGKEFPCIKEAAMMSVLIRNMIEDIGYDCETPIPLKYEAITDRVLQKIIDWVEYHYDDPEPDDEFDEDKDKRNEELSYWDKRFIDVGDINVDDSRAFLYDIIDASNWLDIKGLLEVGAKHICNQIKGKTCVEVRKILNVTNDFTTEEEEAIHKENEWIHAKD